MQDCRRFGCVSISSVGNTHFDTLCETSWNGSASNIFVSFRIQMNSEVPPQDEQPAKTDDDVAWPHCASGLEDIFEEMWEYLICECTIRRFVWWCMSLSACILERYRQISKDKDHWWSLQMLRPVWECMSHQRGIKSCMNLRTRACYVSVEQSQLL